MLQRLPSELRTALNGYLLYGVLDRRPLKRPRFEEAYFPGDVYRMRMEMTVSPYKPKNKKRCRLEAVVDEHFDRSYIEVLEQWDDGRPVHPTCASCKCERIPIWDTVSLCAWMHGTADPLRLVHHPAPRRMV
jgi:hypothetical protein